MSDKYRDAKDKYQAVREQERAVLEEKKRADALEAEQRQLRKKEAETEWSRLHAEYAKALETHLQRLLAKLRDYEPMFSKDGVALLCVRGIRVAARESPFPPWAQSYSVIIVPKSGARQDEWKYPQIEVFSTCVSIGPHSGGRPGTYEPQEAGHVYHARQGRWLTVAGPAWNSADEAANAIINEVAFRVAKNPAYPIYLWEE